MALQRVAPASGAPLPVAAGPVRTSLPPSPSASPPAGDGFSRREQPLPPITLASERFQADTALQAIARGGKALATGSHGPAIKRVQLALIACGIALPAGPDGEFSQSLKLALQGFQRQAELPLNGLLDQATLAALDARVMTLDHPADSPLAAAALDSKRFADDPAYQAIARGEQVLGPGAHGETVQKLQLTLLGLGYTLNGGYDSSYGGGTTAAVQQFQQDNGLAASGRLDGQTLLRLDDAAAGKLNRLREQQLLPEEKAIRYRIVADLVRCRAYVLENGTDKPVAAYLISPGQVKYPTQGTIFVLRSGTAMAPWRPPLSEWAKNQQIVEPGLNNPMGIYKLYLGQYDQYFHGVPPSEERALGHPASHGCLRMSSSNVLEFHEKYAGPGSRVALNRDHKESDRLAAAFKVAGVTAAPVTAGRAYLAPYLYGEMGFNEKLTSDGRVQVGGRGS